MITSIIATNLMLTILFLMMKHPLSMGIILLSQTVTISLITGNLNQNFWFSYILFLIMIGGMLILFMYMTSIASNEKFKINLKLMFLLTLMPPIMWLIFPTAKNYMINNEMLKTPQTDMMNMLNKFMNFPMMMFLSFMMIYLLLALIATVKITNFKMGSIRQMN